MSIRTTPRRKAATEVPLDPGQSEHARAVSHILAKATDVLGSRALAEDWIERPAIGLDQRRPIDLLETPMGLEAVSTYLERLDRGVYA